MSKEEFRSFLEAVNADTALQEKLKDAAEPDAVAAIAQSAGYGSVSAELVTDLLEYVAAQSATEPEGEKELSAVSGGLSAGAIAGIVSGSVAGAAVVGLAGYYAYNSRSEGIDAARVSVGSIGSSGSNISNGTIDEQSSVQSYGSNYIEDFDLTKTTRLHSSKPPKI